MFTCLFVEILVDVVNSKYEKKTLKDEIYLLLGDIKMKEYSYLPIETIYKAPNYMRFSDTSFFRAEYKLLKRSIVKYGLFGNIVVHEEIENQKYIILDGHQRYKIFKELFKKTRDPKYCVIPAVIYKNLSEIQKLKITEVLNIRHELTETGESKVFMDVYNKKKQENRNR